MRKYLTSVLATALAAAPLTAQAVERSASPVHDSEQIAANPWIPLLVGLAVAIAIALVVLDDDDDDDEAVSP
jgi:hypothetical protein